MHQAVISSPGVPQSSFHKNTGFVCNHAASVESYTTDLKKVSGCVGDIGVPGHSLTIEQPGIFFISAWFGQHSGLTTIENHRRADRSAQYHRIMLDIVIQLTKELTFGEDDNGSMVTDLIWAHVNVNDAIGGIDRIVARRTLLLEELVHIAESFRIGRRGRHRSEPIPLSTSSNYRSNCPDRATTLPRCRPSRHRPAAESGAEIALQEGSASSPAGFIKQCFPTAAIMTAGKKRMTHQYSSGGHAMAYRLFFLCFSHLSHGADWPLLQASLAACICSFDSRTTSSASYYSHGLAVNTIISDGILFCNNNNLSHCHYSFLEDRSMLQQTVQVPCLNLRGDQRSEKFAQAIGVKRTSSHLLNNATKRRPSPRG